MIKIVLLIFIFLIAQEIATYAKPVEDKMTSAVLEPDGRCYIKFSDNFISADLQAKLDRHNEVYRKTGGSPSLKVLERRFNKLVKLLQKLRPKAPTKIGTVVWSGSDNSRKKIEYETHVMAVPPVMCKLGSRKGLFLKPLHSNRHRSRLVYDNDRRIPAVMRKSVHVLE